MVVVAILHALGGVIRRRGSEAVNGHPQEQVAALHDGLDVANVAAGVGHVFRVAHFGQAGEASALKSHAVGLDKIDGPAIAGTFLKCGKTDRLACGQLKVSQGDHSVDRVAADAERVVLDERCIITDEDIVC